MKILIGFGIQNDDQFPDIKFRQKNFPYGDDAGFNAPAPQPKAPPPNGEGEGGVSEKDAATVTSAGSK